MEQGVLGRSESASTWTWLKPTTNGGEDGWESLPDRVETR